MQKIIYKFVLAHFDDEIFCMGKILKILEEKLGNVEIFIVCGNEVKNDRKNIFIEFCKNHNIMYKIGKYVPTKLQNTEELRKEIDNFIKYGKYIFTHSDKDYHEDHKIINHAVYLSSRLDRNKDIIELYEMHSQGTTSEFGKNLYYVNINKHILEKKSLCKKYSEFLKGANCCESILNSNKCLGNLSGLEYAEVYSLKLRREI